MLLSQLSWREGALKTEQHEQAIRGLSRQTLCDSRLSLSRALTTLEARVADPTRGS